MHTIFPFFGEFRIAMPQPSAPLIIGSTTVRVIAEATKASYALPPFFKQSIPACVASGCAEITPCFPYDTD